MQPNYVEAVKQTESRANLKEASCVGPEITRAFKNKPRQQTSGAPEHAAALRSGTHACAQ